MTSLPVARRRDRFADWTVVGLVLAALLAGLGLRSAILFRTEPFTVTEPLTVEGATLSGELPAGRIRERGDEPLLRARNLRGGEDGIYSAAETDRNGYFELPLPLERGESYSLIVWAECYEPASGDHLLVGDDPSPLEVEVTLQRE